VEADKDRICFALSSGRIQAVYSPSASPDELINQLPPELADLGPLLTVTLADRQDSQVSGLIRLLERNLSDPRRLRALLRFQSSVLTYRALTATPGLFVFLQGGDLPPMFQAFPLNVSLPALAVEGVRRCDPVTDPAAWAGLVYDRSSLLGSHPDRAGLSPVAVKIHASFDGQRDLSTLAREFGMNLEDVVGLARGLELTDLVERRSDAALVMVLEEDAETIEVIQHALSGESLNCHSKSLRTGSGPSSCCGGLDSMSSSWPWTGLSKNNITIPCGHRAPPVPDLSGSRRYGARTTCSGSTRSDWMVFSSARCPRRPSLKRSSS
jgi:hypothetical protein